MTEYERVREQIAKLLLQQEFNMDDDMANEEWQRIDEQDREDWQKDADQILSLDGICIKSDDQSLPDIKTWWDSTVWRNAYQQAQQDMLAQNWVKCLKKE